MTIASPGETAGKLTSVQMLRAAAAALVVLYHLSTTSPFGRLGSGDRLGAPAAFFEAIGFAGVDLFFVISGVVMMVASGDQFGRRGASGRFLLRRAARIYPLYWLVTLAVLAACWLRPELAVRDKLSAAFVVKSLVLWPQREFPVVAVGWTLTYEMFFYLVFAVLLALPRRAAGPLLASWGVLTLVLYAALGAEASTRTVHRYLDLPLYASPLALEFILGCAIGGAMKAPMRWTGGALAAGILALATVGAYVGWRFPEGAQFGLMRLLVFGLPAALIVYGAVEREVGGGAPITRWIVFWGDASYSTYLTHVYVIWLFSRTWPHGLTGNSTWPLWVAAAGCLVCCAAVGATSYLCIELPIQRRLGRALKRPTGTLAETSSGKLELASRGHAHP